LKPHTFLEICLQLVLIVVLDQLGWSHSLFQAFPRSLTAIRLDFTLTFTCKLVEPRRNFCRIAHKLDFVRRFLYTCHITHTTTSLNSQNGGSFAEASPGLGQKVRISSSLSFNQLHQYH
jgi:hypothetical protein